VRTSAAAVSMNSQHFQTCQPNLYRSRFNCGQTFTSLEDHH
jgi:hypothetical protein